MEKKKTGRPTNNPKGYRESFRFSEEDMEKIRFCMEKTGKSKTDVLRMAIEELHKVLKLQNVQFTSRVYESGIAGKISFHETITAEETVEPPIAKEIIFTSTDPEWIKQQN